MLLIKIWRNFPDECHIFVVEMYMKIKRVPSRERFYQSMNLLMRIKTTRVQSIPFTKEAFRFKIALWKEFRMLAVEVEDKFSCENYSCFCLRNLLDKLDI